ncbi:hypothetical protein glysoja_048546 [Glycine soja]|uniref:Reverse transcriptase domain-containing protein n=1 Tax=Glycine soja TaxID=3848 RepID=A0A0B2SP88_GLYSO|nr:hypothetical protein glysoja_048546 [Glycine soja]
MFADVLPLEIDFIESDRTNHVSGSTHTSDFLYEVKAEKPSPSTTVQPTTPELKPLPSNLKYAYLDDSKSFPVIISASLADEQEEKLLSVLKKHKNAIGWTLADIPGISPSTCMHRINLEDGAKPIRQPQRRLKPDQLAQLRPQIASHESQKQFLMLEKQTMLQRMEILEKEINFRESDLEMKKEQVKYLRESYPMNQAKQLQEQFLNWNIGLQDPMSNDPIPNCYTNSDQVAGNYELETSYMPPADLSQMWMPNVPNMNEVNLSLPNNMGSMVSNVYETNLSHPNYMGPMTPNMDGMNLNLPNYTGSMAPSDMNAMQFSLPNNMGQMVPIMDETNLNLPNFMGSMAPEMNEMNFSLPSNIGSMAPNPPSGTFPNPNLD